MAFKGYFHSDKLAEFGKPSGNRLDYLFVGDGVNVGKWFVKDLRNVIGSAGVDMRESSIAHQFTSPNLDFSTAGTSIFYLSPLVEVYRGIFKAIALSTKDSSSSLSSI